MSLFANENENALLIIHDSREAISLIEEPREKENPEIKQKTKVMENEERKKNRKRQNNIEKY